MIFKLTITSIGADPSIKVLNSNYVYSKASLLLENFLLAVKHIKKHWPFNTNIEIKLSIMEENGDEKMLLKTDQHYE